MTTLLQWSGDGLSGNLTTSSAGTGDTAPSFITGAVPTIEPVAARSPAIRFAQADTTVNYVVWTFSAADLAAYSFRLYAIFTAFVATGAGAVVEFVNAADTLLAWGVAVNSAGRLQIIDKNGATQATGTVSLTAGARYRIEATVNGSAYAVYAYLGESSTVVDSVTVTLASPVSGGKIRLGNAFGSPLFPAFYLDDLLIGDTPALVGSATVAELSAAYVTLAELKTYLGITNTNNDTQLDDARTAASRAIDQFCGRQFNMTTTASARVFYPESCHLARVDDFHTTTGLVIKTDASDDGTFETTWATTDYQLEPLNGVVDGESGWPYYRIRSRTTGANYFPLTGRGAPLQVTAQWGWTAVPAGVKQACYYLAVDLFKLRETQFGVMGSGEWGLVRVRDNPKAMALLAPYRRDPVLVG